MADTGKKSIHEVAISKFKAKCLTLLGDVGKTTTPLRITRRGKPFADAIAISSDAAHRNWMGSMSGTIRITGDVVAPVLEIQ
jgi:hypothetical protein